LMTRERGVQFTIGFLVGKFFGALVSTYPLFGLYFEDSNFGDIVLNEFVNYLWAFNAYHYALAIICGLFIVIWQSDDMFD